MKLHIGPDLNLPAESVTQTFGILAVRGAGKSNTAAVMAEEMFKAKLPFVVVDPVRTWFGLRSSADGKNPGLPIPIFGGRHGDVPLERGAGNLIADLIVDQRLSCVLDLSDFDSESSKKQFLLDFGRPLYQRTEQPLHLFLEEADDYLPQRPMRDEAQLLRAWENIVRRGRNRGLGITLITQRSASINKNVLTQVQTLIAMRTTGPQDIAAIREWVKYHQQSEEILSSLSGLKDGEAWIWSPQLLGKTVRVQIRRRETFDSGATPKMGMAAKAPATLADVDLPALSERMAATIQKAKETDPKELRRQINQLQNELRQARDQKQDHTVENLQLRNNALDQELAILRKERDQIIALRQHQSWSLTQFVKLADNLSEIIQQARARAIPAVDPNPKVQATPPAEIRALPKQNFPNRNAADQRPALAARNSQLATNLRSGERRILQTLAARYPAKYTKIQIGTLTGFAPRGGTFNTYFGVLKRSGFLSEESDGVAITQEGMNFIGSDFPPPPTTTEELQALWRSSLRSGEARMLDELVKRYPNGLSRQELAHHSGFEMRGGTFNTYLGVLRRNGLIEGKDYLKASPTLFLS
jgi:hypothetical protein